MKSCWVKSSDGKTQLEFRELAIPQPGPEELPEAKGYVEADAHLGKAVIRFDSI